MARSRNESRSTFARQQSVRKDERPERDQRVDPADMRIFRRELVRDSWKYGRRATGGKPGTGSVSEGGIDGAQLRIQYADFGRWPGESQTVHDGTGEER